jgi:hypothetical protein
MTDGNDLVAIRPQSLCIIVVCVCVCKGSDSDFVPLLKEAHHFKHADSSSGMQRIGEVRSEYQDSHNGVFLSISKLSNIRRIPPEAQ